VANSNDGGLRPEFRKRLPHYQWTTIEVGAITGGVPDSEFCTPTGVQGWIEFKKTHIFYVHIKPLQVAWLMQRCRYGGNAFIAVRRTPHSKREQEADELWLMKGNQAEILHDQGLTGVEAWVWEGGPNKWNFAEISAVLHNKVW
jgi:hypothetical protein